MNDTATRIEQAIEQAASQYSRLVLLVGVPTSGKTAVLQALEKKLGFPVVNVNLALSKRMLELTRTQRSRQVGRLLGEVVAAVPGNVVLLDNLEILFDISLDLLPLATLRALARNRTIVASWNGSFHDETLIYAEPGHPEFQQFKRPEAIVVSVGTTGHH